MNDVITHLRNEWRHAVCHDGESRTYEIRQWNGPILPHSRRLWWAEITSQHHRTRWNQPLFSVASQLPLNVGKTRPHGRQWYKTLRMFTVRQEQTRNSLPLSLSLSLSLSRLLNLFWCKLKLHHDKPISSSWRKVLITGSRRRPPPPPHKSEDHQSIRWCTYIERAGELLLLQARCASSSGYR